MTPLLGTAGFYLTGISALCGLRDSPHGFRKQLRVHFRPWGQSPWWTAPATPPGSAAPGAQPSVTFRRGSASLRTAGTQSGQLGN